MRCLKLSVEHLGNNNCWLSSAAKTLLAGGRSYWLRLDHTVASPPWLQPLGVRVLSGTNSTWFLGRFQCHSLFISSFPTPFPIYLSFLSQIYLSWKSGPAEVKHWKDMIGRPRTNVAQWHALKAWSRCPASSMAPPSASPPLPPPPPHPVLMHKTDLLPGCETRVQLAICSLKTFKLLSFLWIILSLFSLPLFLPTQPCLIFYVCHLANRPPVSDCLCVCLSVLTRFACGDLMLCVFPCWPSLILIFARPPFWLWTAMQLLSSSVYGAGPAESQS